MAIRDIYGTAFDENVQLELSANQCPECDGDLSTKAKKTVCENRSLATKEQRLNHRPECPKVERGYVVIVPNGEPGDQPTVEIDSVRQNVSFATIVGSDSDPLGR